MSCESVESSTVTEPMTKITTVSLVAEDYEQNLFTPPRKDVREILEVDFVELAGAADAILIGLLDLVRSGFALETDDHGNLFANFRSLGVTVLVENPNASREKNLRRLEGSLLESPVVKSL